MNGTSTFYGCIYTYNGPDVNGAYYGSVILNGNADIYGSVIAYNVTRTLGNGTITYPSSGGGVPLPGEPILYWGIKQSWEEVNPL